MVLARGLEPSRFVSDLRKPTLLAPMTPLVAGWASSPDRPIPLRPFRSDRLACRARRMMLVWPTPSLVALAEGEIRAPAALLVSMLDHRIRLALFHGLVQSVEHTFGTRALDYCPAPDSATEHVEDAQVHELRQGRHVQPASVGGSGGDIRYPQPVRAVSIGPPARHHLGRRPSFSPVARGATPPGPAHIGHACLVPSPQPAVWGAHQMYSVQLIRPDTAASAGAVPVPGWASIARKRGGGVEVLMYRESSLIPIGIHRLGNAKHSNPYDVRGDQWPSR